MVLFQFVHYVFIVYTCMLFARVLGSWVPEFSNHPIMVFVAKCTDPYLNFFRRFIPALGMIDISPIVAFFALQFIESFVVDGLLRMLLGGR